MTKLMLPGLLVDIFTRTKTTSRVELLIKIIEWRKVKSKSEEHVFFIHTIVGILRLLSARLDRVPGGTWPSVSEILHFSLRYMEFV